MHKPGTVGDRPHSKTVGHRDGDSPKLLTIQQAADRLQVTTRTVRRWVDAGTLTGIRLSARCLRVCESSLHNIAVKQAETCMGDGQDFIVPAYLGALVSGSAVRAGVE